MPNARYMRTSSMAAPRPMVMPPHRLIVDELCPQAQCPSLEVTSSVIAWCADDTSTCSDQLRRQGDHRSSLSGPHADQTNVSKFPEQLSGSGRTNPKSFAKGPVTSAKRPVGIAHHGKYAISGRMNGAVHSARIASFL